MKINWNLYTIQAALICAVLLSLNYMLTKFGVDHLMFQMVLPILIILLACHLLWNTFKFIQLNPDNEIKLLGFRASVKQIASYVIILSFANFFVLKTKELLLAAFEYGNVIYFVMMATISLHLLFCLMMLCKYNQKIDQEEVSRKTNQE